MGFNSRLPHSSAATVPVEWHRMWSEVKKTFPLPAWLEVLQEGARSRAAQIAPHTKAVTALIPLSKGARSRAAQIAPHTNAVIALKLLPKARDPAQHRSRHASKRSPPSYLFPKARDPAQHRSRHSPTRLPSLTLSPKRDPAQRRSLGSQPGDSPPARPPPRPPPPTHPPSDRHRAQGRPPLVERATAFREIRSAAGGRGKHPG